MLLGNLASFLGAALALSASLALAAPPAVGKLESRSMRERVRRATVTDPSALDGQSFDYVVSLLSDAAILSTRRPPPPPRKCRKVAAYTSKADLLGF